MRFLGNIKSSFEKLVTDQINFLVSENTKRMLIIPAKATTSGTSIDFSSADGTGIPSWAKKVTVLLKGVRANGTSRLLLQLGAGSVTTTGYISNAGSIGTGSNTTGSSGVHTIGMVLDGYPPTAAFSRSGAVNLFTTGGNVWVCSGAYGDTAGVLSTSTMGGDVTLAGTLDRIRLTTVNGTAFSAGSVSLLIEG